MIMSSWQLIPTKVTSICNSNFDGEMSEMIGSFFSEIQFYICLIETIRSRDAAIFRWRGAQRDCHGRQRRAPALCRRQFGTLQGKLNYLNSFSTDHVTWDFIWFVCLAERFNCVFIKNMLCTGGLGPGRHTDDFNDPHEGDFAEPARGPITRSQ